MDAARVGRRLRDVDAALLRASAHTGEIVPGWWPEPDDDVERWRAWIVEAWTDTIAEAVWLASPTLAGAVEAVCGSSRPAESRVRRMALSLARYLVRARGRATPFGMFAGVSPLRFGESPLVRWTSACHARTRAGGEWLAEVIARLESSPGLLERVPVVLNDLALVRGERLVVPWQPHVTVRDGGLVEVSVRRSRLVQAVMEEASSPILAGDLVGKLAAAVAVDAPVSAIEGVVAELVARGVLVTSLRPPSTSTNGLSHLLAALDEVGAEAVGEVVPLVAELRVVAARLAAAEDAEPWLAGGPARRVAAGRMRTLADGVAQPLVVDLRLGTEVVLPGQVVQEAELAADALLRLAPDPAGVPAWREYHALFLERYGPGALVPVRELVSSASGLGYPRHLSDPSRLGVAAGLTARDERLLAVAQRAALDGTQEVVLDERGIADLAAGALTGRRPVPHVDLCAEVHASTMAGLAEGRFTILVTGVGHTAAALTGRFLDLLPEAEWRRVAPLYRRLPVGVAGALPVQLSFPPNRPDAENVTRVSRVLPGLVTLAEHRSDGTTSRLHLEDLLVTADTCGLYLLSMSQRRPVEPVVLHAAARHTMPPLARFLFELPRAMNAPVPMFDWGAAACLPFLPRVRYGRIVLAPARWRISAGDLPGSSASWREWTAAMAGVRGRLGLPTVVSVGRADQLLRLDLDQPMDLTLLRAHLDKNPDATVREASTQGDHGWFGGRAHEIVIPLATIVPPVPAPAVVTTAGRLPLVDRHTPALPGGRVLFAKLYGHPDVFDTILTEHLPGLLAQWDEEPRWWFIRYQDPAPHLRLRLHVADYATGAARLGRWADHLRRQDLIGDLVLDTYRPEIGRYGTSEAMAAAEALFAADSAAVIAQLTAIQHDRRVHPYALTAASLADLASAMTGGRPAGMRWLLNHPDLATRGHDRDREVLRQAISLADCPGPGATLDDLSHGAQVQAAWQARHNAAGRYVDTLAGGRRHLSPESVLVSLLHLHHVRMHGIDPAAEARTHRLARAIGLAWRSRQQIEPEST